MAVFLLAALTMKHVLRCGKHSGLLLVSKKSTSTL